MLPSSGEWTTAKQKTARLMAFFLAAFTLLFGGAFYLNGQIASFEDSRLEELVRDVLETPEGKIWCRRLRSISSLDAKGKGIESLVGIEHLSNLKHLYLEDNQVRDLTPLKHLPLEKLCLRNNGITDLEEVNFSALKSSPLTHLSLRHNVIRPSDAPQVRLSDISVLAHFRDLEWLELRDNHIEDIEPLRSLTALKMLDLSQNPLKKGSIKTLSKLSDLETLNVRETGLTTVAPLSGLTNLNYLNLHSNPHIDTIAPLQGLVLLETLILRNVPVEDEILYLSNLHQLRRLNLRGCSVSDLTILGKLMEAGALQDDFENRGEAAVDIRNNPIPIMSIEGVDGYEPVRPYWPNISGRLPEKLPP